MLLGLNETKKLLKKYKIPFPKSELVGDKDEAGKCAKAFGYPVVLKITSTKILHKTDIGGVILDIKNGKELKIAFGKIRKVQKRGGGIIVQKQISGTQIIMGAKIDPVFGPVIMFGLGGIFTEVLKDVSFRIAPITKKEARKMIKEIKGYKILTGYRGKKAVKIERLERILLALSELIISKPQIKEVDFNPVIVNQKEALVVDAKILV